MDGSNPCPTLGWRKMEAAAQKRAGVGDEEEWSVPPTWRDNVRWCIVLNRLRLIWESRCSDRTASGRTTRDALIRFWFACWWSSDLCDPVPIWWSIRPTDLLTQMTQLHVSSTPRRINSPLVCVVAPAANKSATVATAVAICSCEYCSREHAVSAFYAVLCTRLFAVVWLINLASHCSRIFPFRFVLECGNCLT